MGTKKNFIMLSGVRYLQRSTIRDIPNDVLKDIDLNSKKEVPHEFKVAYNASLKSKINFLTKTNLEQIKDVRMLKIFRDNIRSHIQSTLEDLNEELLLKDELKTVNRLLKNQTNQIELYEDLHFLDKISDDLFS